MASIKADVSKGERGVLNTTIDKTVLDNFKAYCKSAGLPMNTILETFMNQFANGEFMLRVGKNNKMDIDQ